MAKTSMSQRKTMVRVMHEYTHGELKRGPRGKRGKDAKTTTRRSPRRRSTARASR